MAKARLLIKQHDVGYVALHKGTIELHLVHWETKSDATMAIVEAEWLVTALQAAIARAKTQEEDFSDVC